MEWPLKARLVGDDADKGCLPDFIDVCNLDHFNCCTTQADNRAIASHVLTPSVTCCNHVGRSTTTRHYGGDVQQLVSSELEEHLQLEYKSSLYDGGDRGCRESLLDICMFANSGGGILLLGISEQRDANGQPTGVADPNAELGIETQNPEMVLQSYDARVIANIQDRLSLESYAIHVANNRHVIAIRVPNSMSKPHRVSYQGHVYFPSRRERQRYEMDVREIKEMVMRTASRLEEAQDKLSTAIDAIAHPNALPTISIGSIPVFWQNFMVDIQKQEVIRAVSEFHLGYRNFLQPTYNFNGLVRQIVAHEDSFVQVHRDGGITLNKRLDQVRTRGGTVCLMPTAIDILLRAFVEHCSRVYEAAAITGPFLLTMLLRTPQSTSALFPSPIPGAEEQGGVIGPGGYPFPIMQADNLLEIDKAIRPLCDQAHQMFGRPSSPFFDDHGVWRR
jgi:hypothetical protein